MRTLALLVLLALVPACALVRARLGRSEQPRPEAVSLLGKRLYAHPLPPEERFRLEAELAAARSLYGTDPLDADHVSQYALRLAQLGRHREAIDVLGEGIRRLPADAHLYRDRGYRYLVVRRLDDAVADLERAVDLIRERGDAREQPDAAGEDDAPATILHGSIWHHLGLAYYLRGEWENAAQAFEEALALAPTDDMQVAARGWLFVTLWRTDRGTDALRLLGPVHRAMRVLENESELRRLLMYKGEIAPDSLLPLDRADPHTLATYGYSVGGWHLFNGRSDLGREILERVTAETDWTALGHIAAEAELARMRRADR